MPKINVYLPDELADAVKDAGIPVSAVCQRALEQAVRRVTAVREAGTDPVALLSDPAGQLANLTARARDVLRAAVEQARAADAPAVGTEHVLAALVADTGCLAARVLGALEITPRQVTDALAVASPAGVGAGVSAAAVDDDRALGTAARGAGSDVGTLGFTAAAERMVELTLGEALAMGHNYIGTEHVLLGLVAEPDGDGGRVLRSLGAEQRLTRRAVAAALAAYKHLQAASPAAPAMAAAAGSTDVAALLRQHLEPIVRRLERLESGVR